MDPSLHRKQTFYKHFLFALILEILGRYHFRSKSF